MTDKNKAWEKYKSSKDFPIGSPISYIKESFEAGQKSSEVKAYNEGKLKGMKLGERNERERILKILNSNSMYDGEIVIKMLRKEIEGDNNEHCEDDWKVLPDGKDGNSK